ncbi:hypothetical protein B7463_g2851, partial [Scytalidium lignicola]
MQVSSKYLELTKKKLELARLPHEKKLRGDSDDEPGTPRSEIEPLVDFCFPLTNLSLTTLFEPLTDPNANQPFHLVAPSIPGIGFSDAFTGSNQALLSSTASVFNTLMLRLGYDRYIVSASGSGTDSPAEIDYHLPRLIAELYPENCLGVHLINPPLAAPTLIETPWLWAKFAIAKLLRNDVFGYVKEDLETLKEASLKEASLKSQAMTSSGLIERINKRFSITKKLSCGVAGMVGFRNPNTLAYALCDSPVGVLSYVCNNLRNANPEHELSNTEILDITELTWLPGPEAGLRFAAAAVEEVEALAEKRSQEQAKTRRRSIVGLTVFHDGNDNEWKDGEDVFGCRYTCPAWAEEEHEVVFAQRLCGHAGLLAFEKPDVIADGIRGLARELLRVDDRLTRHEFDDSFLEDDTTDAPRVAAMVEEKPKRHEEETGGMEPDTANIDRVMPVEMEMSSSDLGWEKIEKDGEMKVMRNGIAFDSRWLICWVVIFSIWKPKLKAW